jgi:hypothetical protein
MAPPQDTSNTSESRNGEKNYLTSKTYTKSLGFSRAAPLNDIKYDEHDSGYCNPPCIHYCRIGKMETSDLAGVLPAFI